MKTNIFPWAGNHITILVRGTQARRSSQKLKIVPAQFLTQDLISSLALTNLWHNLYKGNPLLPHLYVYGCIQSCAFCCAFCWLSGAELEPCSRFLPSVGITELKCSLWNGHTKCKLCFKLLSFNLTWITYLELQIKFPIFFEKTRQPAKSTLRILSEATVHCSGTCVITGFLVLPLHSHRAEIDFWINPPYPSSPTSIRVVYHNKPKVHLVECAISSDGQYQTSVAACQKRDNREWYLYTLPVFNDFWIKIPMPDIVSLYIIAYTHTWSYLVLRELQIEAELNFTASVCEEEVLTFLSSQTL